MLGIVSNAFSCVVLSYLQKLLVTPAQWAVLVRQFVRQRERQGDFLRHPIPPAVGADVNTLDYLVAMGVALFSLHGFHFLSHSLHFLNLLGS
jgi:hypothetical protein